MRKELPVIQRQQKRFIFGNGKIYFSAQTERKFYLVLTIIMLLSGILAQAGILN
ncbi:MAG: hypothetical protein R6X10_00340 [Desulfobacterales bacterium]